MLQRCRAAQTGAPEAAAQFLGPRDMDQAQIKQRGAIDQQINRPIPRLLRKPKRHKAHKLRSPLHRLLRVLKEEARERAKAMREPELPRIGEDLKTGCWEWMGGLNESGYGMMRTDGRTKRRAHRAMWERYKGKIPPGMLADAYPELIPIDGSTTVSCVNLSSRTADDPRWRGSPRLTIVSQP